MKFHFRGLTSLLLAILFLVMVFSGVILYFPSRGSTGWINRLMFGLGRQGWEAIHVNVCLSFTIVAVVHLIVNWALFWGYIKRAFGLSWRMKTELLIAVVLSGIIVAGTVYRLPPFSMIKGYGDRRGSSEGRGPGFGRGPGQGQGEGQGEGRQFRGGR